MGIFGGRVCLEPNTTVAISALFTADKWKNSFEDKMFYKWLFYPCSQSLPIIAREVEWGLASFPGHVFSGLETKRLAKAEKSSVSYCLSPPSVLHRNTASKEAIVTALKQEARNTCDLLALLPRHLFCECLGMRLVTCTFMRICIRATDKLYCYD